MADPCSANLLFHFSVEGWGCVSSLSFGLGSKYGRGIGSIAESNNLRYADDTTLMGESEEELKILLMKLKEESENVGLNIQKTKIMASGPITS